jgi:hypothetical protein
MKLETTIMPRRDGTVIATAKSGGRYVFTMQGGRLVADVPVDADVAYLLNTGLFLPADEADFEAAAAMVQPEDSGVDDGSVVGEVEDLDDDEPADENAAPVETPTPRKPGRPKKVK